VAEELLVGCGLRKCLVQAHVVGKEPSQLVLLILRHDDDSMCEVLSLLTALERVSVDCLSIREGFVVHVASDKKLWLRQQRKV